jgi:2Fe-2S ferredoxin
MVNIIIENLGQKEVPIADFNKSALQHIQSARVDWLQACGGKGRCTSCKLAVLEGSEHLSEMTPPEIQYRRQGFLKSNERLACQVKVSGDVVIRVPEDTKLSHLKYTG